jgi:hypothetical protein
MNVIPLKKRERNGREAPKLKAQSAASLQVIDKFLHHSALKGNYLFITSQLLEDLLSPAISSLRRLPECTPFPCFLKRCRNLQSAVISVSNFSYQM